MCGKQGNTAARLFQASRTIESAQSSINTSRHPVAEQGQAV